LGKIAPESKPASRVLSEGDGWCVADVVCTAGPHDRPFEERHSWFSIALVAAGSFQYRSTSGGRELMTPGSILLGNAGQCFECGHEHDVGDHCIAFRFSPEYFERIVADAGARLDFRVPRLPPLRATSPVIVRISLALAGSAICLEELGIQLAARAIQVAEGLEPNPGSVPPSALARVTSTVRRIEREQTREFNLAALARDARLSPYHFLRTFHRLTGVTPHQFILRKRLREAALRLVTEPAKVLDVALDCGFGDLSNFNHAFRAEFGVSPSAYRKLYFAIL
jgi:AraC family transcriptional regulator